MSDQGLILALAGGGGGAKMALGLSAVCAPEDLRIVVNTADDFEHLGVHVSPDLDSVMYALAGIANRTTGWGIEGDTFRFIDGLEALGGKTWFRLGDRDLATNVERTRLLRDGMSLSSLTARLAGRLGITHPLIPMTDDAVRTVVQSDAVLLAFQDYFVRLKCEPVVTRFNFDGVADATPSPGFAAALGDPRLAGILISPSNPFVSIDPILALPGIRAALEIGRSPVVAVSPIIGGRAVKGPAAKMMRELGHEPSALGIARIYAGLADGLVIDHADAALASAIEALGMHVLVTTTLVQTLYQKACLAREALEFLGSIGSA